MLRRFVPAIFVTAVACKPGVLDGYDDEASQEAFERWAADCPEHYAEIAADIPQIAVIYGKPSTPPDSEPGGGTYRERARKGELEALNCMILHYEWISAGLRNMQAERESLLAALYTRWRLHGAGRGELNELASQFPRETIELFIRTEHSLSPALPDIEKNACRNISRTDPAYEVIMRGAGRYDPAQCRLED